MRLGMLVDAACDLPRAFIAQNPIRVMPIPIRIGKRERIDVRDAVDTTNFFLHVLAGNVPGSFTMRVFDSGSLYAGQGVQVTELTRLIRADTPTKRIVRRMEEIIPQTYSCMVPSDLHYLYARARGPGALTVGIVAQPHSFI